MKRSFHLASAVVIEKSDKFADDLNRLHLYAGRREHWRVCTSHTSRNTQLKDITVTAVKMSEVCFSLWTYSVLRATRRLCLAVCRIHTYRSYLVSMSDRWRYRSEGFDTYINSLPSGSSRLLFTASCPSRSLQDRRIRSNTHFPGVLYAET